MSNEMIELMKKQQSDLTKAVNLLNEANGIHDKLRDQIKIRDEEIELLKKQIDLTEQFALVAFHALFESTFSETERKLIDAWDPNKKIPAIAKSVFMDRKNAWKIFDQLKKRKGLSIEELQQLLKNPSTKK